MTSARYFPEAGGTEIHVHEVARRLIRYGADVTVLSTHTPQRLVREGRMWSQPEDSHEVPLVRVRAWPARRDYYFAPGMLPLVRRSRADIVHCQGYHTFVAPIVMLAALSAGIPYIVSLHSGGHSSRLRRALRPVQARLLRPLLRRASKVIASSQFEAELFAERTQLPFGSLAVVPSGVDLPEPEPQDRHAEPRLLLSMGRVESYKGHHRVLDALSELNRKRPGIQLHVVGTGPYEAELWRRAERLGVSHLLKIAAIPVERRDEMARLLARAGCVAMLSDYESQGLAIQEALALGCPLVVTDTTALNDLRGHPNVRALPLNATAAQVAAAIDEMLDAPEVLPPQLTTWDQCARRLLDIYLESLGSRRR